MARRLSVAFISTLLVFGLTGGIAWAHGDCSLRIWEPFTSGVLGTTMNAKAKFTCTEPHARLAIRVKLQALGLRGFFDADIMNDSNTQTKSVSAQPHHRCFVTDTGVDDVWRTQVVYTRVFNASGALIAEHSSDVIRNSDPVQSSCLFAT